MMGMGMMMGGKGGGAPKAMPVAQELQDAIMAATANSTRAIKFTVDAKRPRLLLETVVAGGASFADDFGALDLKSLFVDATPCAVLLRALDEAGTIPGAKEGVFVYCGWMPAGVPVKQKMAWSSALSSLKEGMPGVDFREFNLNEREEAKLDEIVNVAKELTDAEKYDLLTDQERAELRVKEESARLQKEYDAKLKPKETFGAALGVLFTPGGVGQAFFAKLGGGNFSEIHGGEHFAAADAMAARKLVPQDAVGWCVCRSENTTIQVFEHIPDGAPANAKKSAPNFNHQVVELFKAHVPAAGLQLEQVEFDKSGGYKLIM